jgi:ABC-type glutathione transport system ATPase component
MLKEDAQHKHGAVDLAAAPRMQILYEALKVTASVKDKEGGKQLVDKAILKGVSGVIQPGRLTAVMGSSGAGKTTFLNVLVRGPPLPGRPASCGAAARCAAAQLACRRNGPGPTAPDPCP